MLKTKRVTIEKGRDKGKTFLITELPIVQADRMAMKIIHAVANAGFDLGRVTADLGVLALSQVAMETIGRIEESKLIEISADLLKCVKIVPDGGEARDIEVDLDVRDVLTLMRLRKEAIAIHVDFLTDGDS